MSKKINLVVNSDALMEAVKIVNSKNPYIEDPVTYDQIMGIFISDFVIDEEHVDMNPKQYVGITLSPEYVNNDDEGIPNVYCYISITPTFEDPEKQDFQYLEIDLPEIHAINQASEEKEESVVH